MTDPKKLVERLLSGKPTPLEREAGEALASLADELRLARERVAELIEGMKVATNGLQMRYYDRAHELPTGGWAIYDGGHCLGYGETEQAAIDTAMKEPR